MIKKICAAICGRHPGPISPSTTRSYSSGPLRTMPRPSKPLGDAARRLRLMQVPGGVSQHARCSARARLHRMSESHRVFGGSPAFSVYSSGR